MAWYMPSYGRPGRLVELLKAPGGWPEVNVLLNEDDPTLKEYVVPALWRTWMIPAGSHCADAHRWITDNLPFDSFYGLICDDQWPETEGWWSKMERAAEDRYIALASGEPSFGVPKIRNAVCFGGALVRAMGSLVPLPVKHSYEDDWWDTVARVHGLLRPLSDVIVYHRRPGDGWVPMDATYERGYSTVNDDHVVFKKWLLSAERRALDERVRECATT